MSYIQKCVPKETKGINVKVFNMITNKNVAKTLAKIFRAIVNGSSIVQLTIQIKNEIAKLQCERKSYGTCKKDYNWNPSNVFVRIVST